MVAKRASWAAPSQVAKFGQIGSRPCWVCGATRSARMFDGAGNVVCQANANGRDRCREREVRNMLAGAPTPSHD